MTINAQLSYDTFGDDEESRGATYDQTIKIRPVIGIWEDNFVNPETAKIGRWLARTNDTYTAMPNNKIGFQTYTLITAVKLVKDVK
ncbi:hypothetical protein [Myroides pelagicus]|uniref:Uncharacterized protein n=1 Tax=Myroides pelagicus TaxID=270914 RepID=A0A7K1GLC5_9FLAO|nr:hypothetical protein [Myroides pelagicus]MTH29339.1 hypothetical protein [Myroides pelagicus]